MKRITAILLVILLSFILPSCASLVIEDTNGPDDYSLQTITDEQIIFGMNTSKMMSFTSTVNNNTTAKCRSLSGVQTLCSYNINGDLTVNVTSEVNSGNARLVLIINEKIINDFNINGSSTYTLTQVSGLAEIKIAGESANYNVTVVVE